MFSNLINHYNHYPNFSYKIHSKEQPAFYCLPERTDYTILINYTDCGVYTSRFYWADSLHPGEFTFSTDLSWRITDAETGEILGEFYGFRNPDFNTFIDSLIERGAKFDLCGKNGYLEKFGRNPTYKRLKSGKWRKWAA